MTNRTPSKVDVALNVPTGIDFKDKATLQEFVKRYDERIDQISAELRMVKEEVKDLQRKFKP